MIMKQYILGIIGVGLIVISIVVMVIIKEARGVMHQMTQTPYFFKTGIGYLVVTIKTQFTIVLIYIRC
jgi:hypothetical protein